MALRRYNPCSYLPRRLQIVTSLTLFILITILFFGSSSDRAQHYREELSEGARRAADYIPDRIGRQLSDSPLNPFRVSAHDPPPEQANSTSGDISWFSDWKWRNPFSAAIAYDDRSVLPPEAKRTPVYTYYDYDMKKDKAERQAENDLLLTWRRAWWAKGFKPIILSRSDAHDNGLYERIQAMDLKDELEKDVMRWLAWGNMGTGILSNWLAYPMCDYDDPMLTFLRHGEFPKLTRFKGLGNGFFVGEKKVINEAIQAAFTGKETPKADTLMDILPKTVLNVDSNDGAIAFYSIDVIKSKYGKLHDKLHTNMVEGKIMLRRLVESHLHSTWQSLFPEGIAVLQPIQESMIAATQPAKELAKNLSSCLDTPFPAACPPNIAKCKTCMTSQPMPISTPKVYVNDSDIFTLGIVPHPYTMNALIKKQSIMTSRFIRRETERDNYILAVTREALGTGKASFERIVYMKDAVASDRGKAHNLWMTAERSFDRAWRDDLSWIFGFPIPYEPTDDGKSETPVPGPERRPKPKKPKFVSQKMPDEQGVQRQADLIDESKAYIKKRSTKKNKHVRQAMEAWNLADTELWNFVRAFAAQRRMEREKWEEEERKYAGARQDGRKSWRQWLGKEEVGQ